MPTTEQLERASATFTHGLDLVDACYPDADRAAALICGPAGSPGDLAATAERVSAKWAARIAGHETTSSSPGGVDTAVGA
jgi:hypothetical protein